MAITLKIFILQQLQYQMCCESWGLYVKQATQEISLNELLKRERVERLDILACCTVYLSHTVKQTLGYLFENSVRESM